MPPFRRVLTQGKTGFARGIQKFGRLFQNTLAYKTEVVSFLRKLFESSKIAATLVMSVNFVVQIVQVPQESYMCCPFYVTTFQHFFEQ